MLLEPPLGGVKLSLHFCALALPVVIGNVERSIRLFFLCVQHVFLLREQRAGKVVDFVRTSSVHNGYSGIICRGDRQLRSRI